MKSINMQNGRYVQQSNVDQSKTESEPKHVTSGDKSIIGRLFVLNASSGEIFSLNGDGSDKKVIISGARTPDGIVVDVEAGHIYWTMGIPNVNDGSIERAKLDGQNRTMIVPQGGTFTPKQIHLDKKNGKWYWSYREGMRVMRSNLDGSMIETLVQNGQGEEDRRNQMKRCVGKPFSIKSRFIRYAMVAFYFQNTYARLQLQ